MLASTTDVQLVTIQSFPLKSPSPADTIDKLTEATSQFKASTKGKIERAFLGKISDSVVEQIYLHNISATPDVHNEDLDTVTPFLPFASSPAEVNVSTAVLNNKTSLHKALSAPCIETIAQDLIPDTDVEALSEALMYLGNSLRNTSGGYGSSFGFSTQEGRTRLVVINGWESYEHALSWGHGLDSVGTAYFQSFGASLDGGSPKPTFKSMAEIN